MLKGTLLQHIATVTFGETPGLDPKGLSPVQISCTIPPHSAFVVGVYVTDDKGRKSNSVNHTFVLPPDCVRV